jgi:amino acid adenylation domain-containing protein
MHLIFHNRQKLLSDLSFGTSIAGALLQAFNEERDKKVTNSNKARRRNSGRCVHRLVEDQAAIRPHATAIEDADCSVSYKEMNDRSAVVADELRRLGIGRDVVVAVCMKRSIEMIIAALAVLKAGGAYLPLDPSFPLDRLSFILKDAKVSAALKQAGNNPLPDGSWKTLVVSKDGGLAGTDSHALKSAEQTSFSDLAYVIYTSGSTGEPKGVEVEHRSLLNLIDWHQRRFSISQNDRASQIAGPAFDAAAWEIWPYLTAGASVHIAPESVRTDPKALRDWLVSQEITMSFIPTPLAEPMLNLQWPANTKLHSMLTGGDALHTYPPSGLPFKLVNNYGPTECTVVATSCEVQPAPNQNQRPPIGSPITNTRVYVLDDGLKPVAMGTQGELYIGGAGVARGYRNRPDLTAIGFIADPFAKDGSRMYKTGDLARLGPDGQIAFLGRIDDQIKIRGYRIELDEISAALNRHQRISQSAVVARRFSGEEQRLVGYIVPSGDEELTRSELHEFLQSCLPEYMIPSVFVRIDTLPLTANGKVDKERLPEPGVANTVRDGAFETPHSIVEQRVATLLSELLEIKHVGLRDNFFHLGGHSLLGAQVIARVRDLFEVDLPLRTLFDNPTVAGISVEIERLILAKLEHDENQRAESDLSEELDETAA